MEKKIGASLLIAGTCIGSGMIALPIVLAPLGLIPSFFLMLVVWFVMYYSSLVNLELNLQAGKGLTLGELGKLFSGKIAESLGIISLKVLSYSLLAAFIYGGASILHELTELPFIPVAAFYTFTLFLLLLLPIRWIDYCNRLLFIALLAILLLLVSALILSIHWAHLPLVGVEYKNWKAWGLALPVVFTSFGFQVIFHTLTNYCHKDSKVLKSAFFGGTLLAAMVYLVWTLSVLSVVYYQAPLFYTQMTEVGQLVEVLSEIANWKSIQLLVWWVSSLALATSALGVGIGFSQSLKELLSLSSMTAALLTLLPPFLIAIFVPNAFITVLSFAGMILAFIAILLPIYLYTQLKQGPLFYPELKKKPLLWLSVIMAFLVILSGVA